MTKAPIDIAIEHAQLCKMTIFELRGEWRRLHRAPPPMRLSRDVLMRGITYKLQERLLGGLSKSIMRKLERLNVDIGCKHRTKARAADFLEGWHTARA